MSGTAGGSRKIKSENIPLAFNARAPGDTQAALWDQPENEAAGSHGLLLLRHNLILDPLIMCQGSEGMGESRRAWESLTGLSKFMSLA